MPTIGTTVTLLAIPATPTIDAIDTIGATPAVLAILASSTIGAIQHYPVIVWGQGQGGDFLVGQC